MEFSRILRGIQLLVGITLLGVASGGAAHQDYVGGLIPQLGYLIFVSVWLVFISLSTLIIPDFWKALRFPRTILFLEGFTLITLIIGVTVPPLTLFYPTIPGSPPTQTSVCRLILDGAFDGRNLYPVEQLNEARLVCQCTLAATIFDGVSILLWGASLIMVVVAWRHKDTTGKGAPDARIALF